MPNDKFLNANDTVDLIKTGIGALDEKNSFDKIARDEQFKNYNIFQISTVGNKNISLEIYISSSSGYNSPITVDWGDGNTQTFDTFSSSNVSLTHVYLNEKIYNVKISLGHQFQYLNGITPKTALLKLAISMSATMTKINEGAFYQCTALKKVVLRKVYAQMNLYTVANSAFFQCTNLEQVEILNFAFDQYYLSPRINFGEYCFYGCLKLKNVDWQFVNSYGNSCFYCCYSLNMPIKILSAGSSCFRYVFIQPITHLYTTTYYDVFQNVFNANILYLHGCTSITAGQYLNQFSELHLDTTTPPSVTNLNLSANCLIYVPKGTLATYKAASGWSTYAANIVEEGAFDKLSTAGGAVTGDITTTNTTFTSTSLVTKQYVDDTIAALNGNSTSY